MIEIIQPGQAGKTSLLFAMHRLRTRVFKEMLKWDVKVDSDGLEVDQFDLPEAVYLLALDESRRVIGNWRLLPTSGPTMIRDVWPQYLKSLPMPEAEDVWEASRFAISVLDGDPKKVAEQTQRTIGEMFCALTELCMHVGIKEIYTLYDERIARVIKRIDCQPCRISDKMPIDGANCQIGAFKTDGAMLSRLQKSTGITESFLDQIELPPTFLKYSGGESRGSKSYA